MNKYRNALRFDYSTELLNNLLYLPEGSVITDVFFDRNRNNPLEISFIVEHDTFEPVGRGEKIPLAYLEVSTKQVVDKIKVVTI